MTEKEDRLEAEAKRLFPFIRNHLHTENELLVYAKKLYPYLKDSEAQDVGNFVLGQAKGMFRKGLWVLGSLLLAALAAWFAK